MNKKERLSLFIKEEGLSNANFERMCGLSNGYVKNSSGNFSQKKLDDILRVFPMLNRDWLLYGKGMMKLPSANQSVNGDNNTAVASNQNMVNNSDILNRALCQKRFNATESRGNWGNWYSCLHHLCKYEKRENITFKDKSP